MDRWRRLEEGSRLRRFEAGEQHEVVRRHGGPDVGLEVVEAAPSAAAGAIGALEAGDAGFDASAEVAQLAVDPGALGHVGDRQAAFFMEGDIADAARLGGIEIVGGLA